MSPLVHGIDPSKLAKIHFCKTCWSEEDQSKFFNRFDRVDKSRSKDTVGTSLGLSIAKWIADGHDSIIRLVSKLGEKAAITVRIPLIS
ncbi:ATP-binding protein [Sporomusa carbonis]|uniref:ATP-binding protein n=1 Tax=Sporomusa carbonis TaxID=3076075 RepID=UPI003C7AE869